MFYVHAYTHEHVHVIALTGPYRNALIKGWVKSCAEQDIPVSENFSLQATLSTSVEVGPRHTVNICRGRLTLSIIICRQCPPTLKTVSIDTKC